LEGVAVVLVARVVEARGIRVHLVTQGLDGVADGLRVVENSDRVSNRIVRRYGGVGAVALAVNAVQLDLARDDVGQRRSSLARIVVHGNRRGIGRGRRRRRGVVLLLARRDVRISHIVSGGEDTVMRGTR